MNWHLYMNFLAAMIAIVNPLGIWPVWSELTDDVTRRKIRRKIAIMVTLTSLFILMLFLLTGEYLLDFFSIDIPVFKVAGGLLLLYTGFEMIQGSATQLSNRDEDGDSDLDIAKQRFRKIIVPLAIPILAGPGSITTVVLYGTLAESLPDYLILALIVLISIFALWLVFVNSEFLEKKVDKTIFTVITRVFGIIVTAIAVQFILEGLGDVFPNWLDGTSILEKGGGKSHQQAF